MKRFGDLDYHLMKDALEMTQDQNKKILVAYKGSAYFIRWIDEHEITLVNISESYIGYKDEAEQLHFLPLYVTKIIADDEQTIKRILDIVCDDENFVNIRYAEIYSVPENEMKVQIEGQSTYKMATGRYFLYNKDHYELQ